MNVALHGSRTGAQKAQQADRHVDVHEELAPFLAGADRQKAKDAQRQAKPRWNQRGRMLTPGAQITRLNQEQSKEPQTPVLPLPREDLPLNTRQAYQLAWMNASSPVDA